MLPYALEGRPHRAECGPLLRAALNDPDASVRQNALVILGEAKFIDALPDVLLLVEDDHPHVRQMALDALGRLGDKRALGRIERALSDARPELRYQAIVAYVRLADPDAARGALTQAFGDEDLNVRYIAIRIAEEHGFGNDAVIVELAHEVLSHDNPTLQLAAALLVAHTDRQEAKPILLAVARRELRTSEREDEGEALECIGRFGWREATSVLEKRAWRPLIADPSAWHARVALAALGHPRAQKEFVADLDSIRREVRDAAVVGIGRARMKDARPLIERLDPSSVDEAVRAEALSQLSEVGL